ncbi:LytTR family DNA-binding domain-containing protein [Litorisediminicola beolgyonensis]|uniref:LytTR family DNA-binding domain-containing protein n=2 Tax=Litorisediminicola beolgyonensis TaxID=1173614 RepID=A0ABW3ZFL4_9RHOB
MRDITGAPIDTTLTGLAVATLSPPGQVYLSMCFLVLIVIDPAGLAGFLTLPLELLLYFAVVLAYVAVYLLLSRVGIAIDRTFRLRAPTLLISALSTLCLAVLLEAMVRLLTHGAATVISPALLLKYVCLVGFFDSVFFLFVFHQILARRRTGRAARASAVSADAQAARHIVIGAERLPIAKIQHIEAREHFVHVTLENRSITQRARLRDIVAQTTPEDGFQPHRSWWVARHGARDIARDGNKLVIRLKDDTKVPVARTRLDELRGWIEDHAPELRQDEAG